MAADAHPMVLLFAQNATGVSFDSDTDTLTLKGVSPVVTFFADRPYRVAGHVLLPGFLQLWDEGSDSFRDDPPNASISVVDGKQIQSAVIEIADPEVNGDQLSYTRWPTVGRAPKGDLSSLTVTRSTPDSLWHELGKHDRRPYKKRPKRAPSTGVTR